MEFVLEALHQGNYDHAFDLLVRSIAISDGLEAANLSLLLAESYTLYAENGLEGSKKALEDAYSFHPSMENNPLYKSLNAEIKAIENQPDKDVRATLPLLGLGTNELSAEDFAKTKYHCAQALMYMGCSEEAFPLLENEIEAQNLPKFLSWRRFTLRGKIMEQLGMLTEAGVNYASAAEIAVGPESYWNWIDAAAMFVETGDGEKALSALQNADKQEQSGLEPEDEATAHYLLARAHLLLGNPLLSVAAIKNALQIEESGAQPAHGTPLVYGQALMQLGETKEAISAFKEALKRSEKPDTTYLKHELSVAYLEAGELGDAETYLREVLFDESYVHAGEAWGDLAEVYYRLGTLTDAENAAKNAVANGAVAEGELILGNLCYDSLQLEKALEHYERADAATAPPNRDWIMAQEMIVDTLAQLGYRNPEEIISRSEKTIPFLPASDEWHETLTNYIQRAKELTGNRTLN